MSVQDHRVDLDVGLDEGCAQGKGGELRETMKLVTAGETTVGREEVNGLRNNKVCERFSGWTDGEDIENLAKEVAFIGCKAFPFSIGGFSFQQEESF